MRTKRSQMDLVRKKLESEGHITRNWCLGNHITRLSAIIFVLKHTYKMNISSRAINNGYSKDFMYTYKRP